MTPNKGAPTTMLVGNDKSWSYNVVRGLSCSVKHRSTNDTARQRWQKPEAQCKKRRKITQNEKENEITEHKYYIDWSRSQCKTYILHRFWEQTI